jgi:glutathione synthase/RimK-type ligase-like ATP-grasp enzyme
LRLDFVVGIDDPGKTELLVCEVNVFPRSLGLVDLIGSLDKPMRVSLEALDFVVDFDDIVQFRDERSNPINGDQLGAETARHERWKLIDGPEPDVRFVRWKSPIDFFLFSSRFFGSKFFDFVILVVANDDKRQVPRGHASLVFV